MDNRQSPIRSAGQQGLVHPVSVDAVGGIIGARHTGSAIPHARSLGLVGPWRIPVRPSLVSTGAETCEATLPLQNQRYALSSRFKIVEEAGIMLIADRFAYT